MNGLTDLRQSKCLRKHPRTIWLCGLTVGHDGEHVAATLLSSELRWFDERQGTLI